MNPKVRRRARALWALLLWGLWGVPAAWAVGPTDGDTARDAACCCPQEDPAPTCCEPPASEEARCPCQLDEPAGDPPAFPPPRSGADPLERGGIAAGWRVAQRTPWGATVEPPRREGEGREEGGAAPGVPWVLRVHGMRAHLADLSVARR